MTDYSSHKLWKLQSESKRRGLTICNNKAELILDLKRHDTRNKDRPPREPIDFCTFTKDPNIYLEMMQYELQEYCDERNLSTTGIKHNLIERLLDYDLKHWTEESSEVLTDINDPIYKKRYRQISARCSFTTKQKDVKLRARLEYHRLGVETIKSTVAVEKAAVAEELQTAFWEQHHREINEENTMNRKLEEEKRKQRKLDEEKRLHEPNVISLVDEADEVAAADSYAELDNFSKGQNGKKGHFAADNHVQQVRLRENDSDAGQNIKVSMVCRMIVHILPM